MVMRASGRAHDRLRPRARGRARAACAVALLLAGACRANEAGPTAESGARASVFKDGLGFDAAIEGRRWQAGDRVLWSVRLTEGESERSWFVEIRSLREEQEQGPTATFHFTSSEYSLSETSPLHAVIVAVEHPGDERAILFSTANVPRRILQRGLIPFCALHVAMMEDPEVTEGAPPEEYTREFARALGSLTSLLQVLEGIESVQEVLWSVLEKPSIVSVVLHGGVKLGIAVGKKIEPQDSASLPDALRGRRAYRVPITIELNERPALVCELTVVDLGPPLGLVGGIVRVQGHPPEQRDRELVMELIGARYGDEPR